VYCRKTYKAGRRNIGCGSKINLSTPWLFVLNIFYPFIPQAPCLISKCSLPLLTMRLFTQLAFASLIALSRSTAIALNRRSGILDVKLTATGNTLLKASITNTGLLPLNLFNKGTFLDSAAVEKVTVSSNGTHSLISIYICFFTRRSHAFLVVFATYRGELAAHVTMFPCDLHAYSSTWAILQNDNSPEFTTRCQTSLFHFVIVPHIVARCFKIERTMDFKYFGLESCWNTTVYRARFRYLIPTLTTRNLSDSLSSMRPLYLITPNGIS
jgi:hypothetical protein